MKEFANFNEFSRHLNRVVAAYPKYIEVGANAIGAALEKSAKEKIGYQQQGAGQFESWEPLAPYTLYDKEKKGYLFKADGNPLYRTGEMMESISFVFNIASRILYVGSTSQIMVYQEFGTGHIPPRSVLGLTMYKALHFILLALRYLVIDWITLRAYSKGRISHGSF